MAYLTCSNTFELPGHYVRGKLHSSSEQVQVQSFEGKYSFFVTVMYRRPAVVELEASSRLVWRLCILSPHGSFQLSSRCQ